MADETPQSEIVLYQTEDGSTRIQCRFENETIWLTQALIAELFQKDVRTVNEHLVNIYDEGELAREATIRKFRIVRQEGTREVAREIEHFSLPAILAVGYRVRSERGTQFRQRATARLTEYLVKGFTMDDERLKNPPGPGVPDYFDELLERIRDIRASEKRMYLRVREILALAIHAARARHLFLEHRLNFLHYHLPQLLRLQGRAIPPPRQHPAQYLAQVRQLEAQQQTSVGTHRFLLAVVPDSLGDTRGRRWAETQHHRVPGIALAAHGPVP